jgi:large subunit ribosomal protein L22e
LFETFLQERIKVEGRPGDLSQRISVAVASNVVTVVVQPGTVFAKRYLKYLTKKFLKKHQLRDWLRVIANGKTSYELRYFNIQQDEEEDDE